MGVGFEGLLLFGKGRDPQIGRKAAGVIRKLEPRASLLNTAAEAPQSYVSPWCWLLWLGFNTETKVAGGGGRAYVPSSSDRTRQG